MIEELIHRAKYILATEGPLSLLRHAAVYGFSYIFRFEIYGIRMHFPRVAGRLDAIKFQPRIANHEFFIVKDNAEADNLESKGYEFRSRVFRAREALNHGGIALIVFVGHEIASVTWIARNDHVQNIFNDPPRKIIYVAGETLICGAATFPKYRRKGLYIYTLFKTLEYLASTGDLISLSFTARGLPIYGISEKLFGSKLIGRGYRLRLLGMQFFWERPLNK